MNERTIAGAMATGLAERVLRPVLIGRLDIATDPITAWTGPGVFSPSGSGDSALDGQIFVTMGPFIELSTINEDQGIGGPVTLTLAGHDLDKEALRQIVRDKRAWRGRGAWLWTGLLNADESSVIVNPVRIKTGVMTQMVTHRDDKGATVTVTIDLDLGNARSAPFRWLDHSRVFSTDTWSTFIIKLANKPQGFGITLREGVGGGGNEGVGDRIKIR